MTSPSAEITLPAMVLNTHSIYPSAGRYVLRLHRDARPENGQLSGRIEHVSSGDSIDFAIGAELLAWLARHAAETLAGFEELECRKAKGGITHSRAH